MKHCTLGEDYYFGKYADNTTEEGQTVFSLRREEKYLKLHCEDFNQKIFLFLAHRYTLFSIRCHRAAYLHGVSQHPRQSERDLFWELLSGHGDLLKVVMMLNLSSI